MVFKLLASIVIFLIAIVELFWAKDKANPKIRKWIFSVLLTLSFLFSLTIIIVDQVETDKNIERQKTYQESLVKKNDSLKTRIGTLKTNLDSLIQLTNTYGTNADSRDIILQAKINELNTQLEPFIKLAIKKYPDMKIEKALDKIQADLEETKKLAQPNSIKFQRKEVTKTDEGYTIRLFFSKTKNEPLGEIRLLARMLGINSKKIIDIWPVAEFGAFESGPDSKLIAKNDKSARLIYTMIGGGNPVVDIKVTDHCVLRIEGNNQLKSFEVEI